MIGCSTWPGEQLRSELVTIRVNSYKEALMDKWYWADEILEELEDQRKREREERREKEDVE